LKLTHPKSYAAIALTLVLALTTLGILRFGNPQWHKYVYIFQAHYFPKYKNGMIFPQNKNGIWNVWDNKGYLRLKFYVKNGRSY